MTSSSSPKENSCPTPRIKHHVNITSLAQENLFPVRALEDEGAIAEDDNIAIRIKGRYFAGPRKAHASVSRLSELRGQLQRP